MHKLYELKEMLCDELEKYGGKDEIDEKGLDIVDKLAHTIKNIDKIIDSSDDDYSMGYDYRGYSRRGRRRDAMGRYSSREGYSRAESDFRMDIEELMREAPNEQTRQKLQRIMSEM